MKEFLHFFGKHHWDKWSEVTKIGRTVPNLSYLDYDGWNKADKINIYGQERNCLICNKKNVREVKIR